MGHCLVLVLGDSPPYAPGLKGESVLTATDLDGRSPFFCLLPPAIRILPPLLWSVTLRMVEPTSPRYLPTKIVIPDLVSYCTFNLRKSRYHEMLSIETKRWLFRGDSLDEHAQCAFHELKASQLAAMCYPNAGYPQLRVSSDFLGWLFHLDNLSDDMDNRSITEVANIVMNSLHHPYTFRSNARLSDDKRVRA